MLKMDKLQLNQHEDHLLVQASQQYEAMLGNAQDGAAFESTTEDDALLQASQKYKSMIAANTGDSFPDGSFDASIWKYIRSRFGNPTTNEDIESVRMSGVPMKTKMSLSWATNV